MQFLYVMYTSPPSHFSEPWIIPPWEEQFWHIVHPQLASVPWQTLVYVHEPLVVQMSLVHSLLSLHGGPHEPPQPSGPQVFPAQDVVHVATQFPFVQV